MIDAVCPGCGHIYPWQTSPRFCKFCKVSIPVGICCDCKQYTEKRLPDGRCYPCHALAQKKYHHRLKAKYVNAFEAWQGKLSVDKSGTLTEEEWLDTVNHFNGCAFCKETDIATRRLLLPRKYGGKYTKTNVIPVCEQCTKQLEIYTDNIFMVSLNTRIVTNPNHFIDVRLPKIIEYLATFIKGD